MWRVGGLAAVAVGVLGVGAVVVAPHIGLTSQPEVTTQTETGIVARPSSSKTPKTSKSRMLGGPITIIAPRTVTTAPKLTWAPPKLMNPITETVTPDHRNLKLDPNRDYVVVLPRTPVTLPGGVEISGGHNVVMIGGVVQVPSMGETSDVKKRRGFYLKGQTGTIHIEGVRMTGDLSDGFNLDEREGATVQIQNVQVDLVHGSHDGHHADVLQTWAGPRILRVDGLRAATEYQGFFLLPTQQWSDGEDPESFVFRRTVLSMMPGSAYAVWLPDRNPPWMDHSGITVRLGGGMSVNKLSWPNSSLGVRITNADAEIDLPAGTPGGSYSSPGYTQRPGF
jgi:hypothetical protein